MKSYMAFEVEARRLVAVGLRMGWLSKPERAEEVCTDASYRQLLRRNGVAEGKRSGGEKEQSPWAEERFGRCAGCGAVIPRGYSRCGECLKEV